MSRRRSNCDRVSDRTDSLPPDPLRLRMNFWGQAPERLTNMGKEAIGLVLLVEIVSNLVVQAWLRSTTRAGLLAECIFVYAAAGRVDKVREGWQELLEMQLLHIDRTPLNGTARVHLTNCLLLALPDILSTDGVGDGDESNLPRSVGAMKAPQRRRKRCHSSVDGRPDEAGPVKEINVQDANRIESDEQKPQNDDRLNSGSGLHQRLSKRQKSEKGERRNLRSNGMLGQETTLLRLSPNGKSKSPIVECEALDSTSLLVARKWRELQQRLECDGFLLLRGVLPLEHVSAAHHVFSQEMEEVIVPSVSAKRPVTTTTEHEECARRFTDFTDKLVATPEVQAIIAPNGALHRQLDFILTGGGSTRRTDSTNSSSSSSSSSSKKKSKKKKMNPSVAPTTVTTAPVTLLPNYTWPRSKPPGTGTIAHADYFFFQHKTSFFTDFDTRKESDINLSSDVRPETKKKEKKEECCTLCRGDDGESWPAGAKGAHRLVVRCNICKRACHVSCLARLSSLSSSSSGKKSTKWHCQECADRPMNMWICWIPLVRMQERERERERTL